MPDLPASLLDGVAELVIYPDDLAVEVGASRATAISLISDFHRASCIANEKRYSRLRLRLGSARDREVDSRQPDGIDFTSHDPLTLARLKAYMPALSRTDRVLLVVAQGGALIPAGWYSHDEQVVCINPIHGPESPSDRTIVAFRRSSRAGGLLVTAEGPGVLRFDRRFRGSASSYRLEGTTLTLAQPEAIDDSVVGFLDRERPGPGIGSGHSRYVVLVLGRLQHEVCGGTILFAPTLEDAKRAGLDIAIELRGPRIGALHEEVQAGPRFAARLRALDDALSAIVSLAIADGAVLVDSTFTVVGAGVKVPVSKEHAEWAKTFRGGTRRRSAAVFCKLVAGGRAFVVSEDGPATAFLTQAGEVEAVALPDMQWWKLAYDPPN